MQGNEIQKIMRYVKQFKMQNSEIPRLRSTRKWHQSEQCETEKKVRKQAGAVLC